MKVFFYTAFALTAFAFNSILCRMALGEQEADAAGFTLVRLLAGAVTLAIIAASFGKTRSVWRSGHWASAFFLFAYAIAGCDNGVTQRSAPSSAGPGAPASPVATVEPLAPTTLAKSLHGTSGAQPPSATTRIGIMPRACSPRTAHFGYILGGPLTSAV